MVYVLANDGQPLMPTKRHRKVCQMLKSGMAKVIKKCPFTIQLQYESERNVQPVSLGVDAGSKHIGISATTKTKVLYESDVELRDSTVYPAEDRIASYGCGKCLQDSSNQSDYCGNGFL